MQRIFYIVFSLLLLLSEVAFAAGNVQFSERELVFAGRMRSAKLTLVNRGDETATVTLGFLQEVHNDRTSHDALNSHQMTNVDDIGLDHFPYNFKIRDAIKITPRRVKLAPGERQVVRLVLRKPLDLADGVYRANIAVEYIDVRHEALDNLTPASKENIAVGIGFVTSVHIPLLVIHGEVETTLDEFKVLKLTKKKVDHISKNYNSDLRLLYKTSGNSIGQYEIGIYADDDLKNPLYHKRVEVSNFTNHHVKHYAILIEEHVKSLRVIVKDLETKEVLYDIRKDVATLY